jgi:hypothetical protein
VHPSPVLLAGHSRGSLKEPEQADGDPSGAAVFDDHKPITGAVVFDERSQVGVARLLSWTVDVRRFAPETPIAVVVNRSPGASFRRGELFEEIGSSVDAVEVVFVGLDTRVTDAAWAGTPVGRSRFARSLERVAPLVHSFPRRPMSLRLDVAS